MFICDQCLRERCVPGSVFGTSFSDGPCEACDAVGVCLNARKYQFRAVATSPEAKPSAPDATPAQHRQADLEVPQPPVQGLAQE